MARKLKSQVKRVQSGESARPGLRNVILVDDDSLVRTALGRLLRGAGYNVTAFERPSDVLLTLLPTSKTCLVVDIYMPEMTGVALWQELQTRGFDVPTVLITGYRDQQTRLYGEQVGAVAVLYKPVEEKELFAAIERALRRPDP
jgi:FixJ family two-component response regulator